MVGGIGVKSCVKVVMGIAGHRQLSDHVVWIGLCLVDGQITREQGMPY